jgi:RNA polymerase sigma factor (sigma-70 family)
MADSSDLHTLHEARQRFLALVAAVRPDLHRYCARMTGSVAEGEDLVQETLARAYYALSEVETMPRLRSWLFQIAHTRAIDRLRRYDVRMRAPTEDAIDDAIDGAIGAEDALAREEAMRAAIARFVELAPAQRSCVILKDVLDHSLEEIAELLQMSVPAVKAALHRGRAQLRMQAAASANDGASSFTPPSATLARYIQLFNARDWDAVRAMLADDVRLDLVSRAQREGRRDVSQYFTNYGSVDDWLLVPARLDGREVIAVFRNAMDATPGYFVELVTDEGRITSIRDYRYVPYIAHDARFEVLPANPREK